MTHNFGTWKSCLIDFRYRANIQGNVGLYVEQELGKYFSAEIGVNDYFTVFDAKGKTPQDSINVDLCNYAQFIQIPLRVRVKLNLIHHKLFLSPHIGANFTIKGYDGINFYDADDRNYRKRKIDYEYELLNQYPKYTVFIQSGLSIEYIGNSWKFGIISTYNRNIQHSTQYKSDIIQTSFHSAQHYLSYKIRIGYALSNIWTKNKGKTHS